MMIDMMMVMKKMKLESRIEESAHLSVMSLVIKFVVVVACDHWLPGCAQRLRGGILQVSTGSLFAGYC